jgi:hypothetical protein
MIFSVTMSFLDLLSLSEKGTIAIAYGFGILGGSRPPRERSLAAR